VHLVVADGLEAFLPMSGLVDLDKELARLSKQQGTLEKDGMPPIIGSLLAMY
jgi:valyl-tRNA synthetase